ncbi:MAG TPA: hypothetical protein VGA64_09110 [Candidatus Polarisedimenticolia bacterium]
MIRRIVAAALLLALAGIITGPVWAGGRSACAMCAKQCCCAPKAAGDRCRLRRACGAGEPSDLTAPNGLGKPAIVPVRSIAGVLSRDEAIAIGSAPRALRLSLPPPDPPPRLAA